VCSVTTLALAKKHQW